MTGIADREFGLIPSRPGHVVPPGSAEGNYALWDDGRQTYTLQWGDGAVTSGHGWFAADCADSLIMSIEAVRRDRDRLRDPEFLRRALRDGRHLRQMAEALEDELIKAARADDTNGDHLLSWREIGSELNVHHTTVRARWERLDAGETAPRHTWLTQNSPADEPAA